MKKITKENIKSKANINTVVNVYNNKTKRSIFVLSVVVVCLIFSIFFLYQPAKDFYFSVRQNDKLQAQYETLKNTNDKLSEDIEFLKTDEGVKQRASETLGLIENGESIGYVSGESSSDGRSNSAASTSSKLAYKNIKTPVKWYSPIGDFIFGYHE